MAATTDCEQLMTARISFDFTGTTALITGGTSGIGHATAVLFRDAGAEVTIAGTKPAASDYDTDLTGMAYHQLQITDPDSVDALARSFTQLDVLFNNAGANFPGGLDESKPDGFDASVALNLTGPYRLTVGLYRALKASTAAGGASVVNLASMSALRAVPLVPGYGAAKAGVVCVTRNLAVKWADKGIRVNAVAPGLIDTPMTAPMRAAPELVDAELAHIPLHRFGSAGEIAPTVAFLCTEQSSYTSGALFVVDGASDCV
jgi:3-oxoacyl-[acyl-carrier protein] reductase